MISFINIKNPQNVLSYEDILYKYIFRFFNIYISLLGG